MISVHPCCIHWNPCFYSDIFLFVFHCSLNVRVQDPVEFPGSVSSDRVWCTDEGGGGGGARRWRLFLRECACKIILARHLLHQAEARYQVPVCLLILQGTGEVSSEIHAVMWTCDCDCELDIYPTMYVWNRFLAFSAMSQLKFASTTKSFLPSIPSTER